MISMDKAVGAAFIAAALIVGCASERGEPPGTGSTSPPLAPSDGVGSLGIDLLTPSGTSLYSMAWTISNGANTYSGDVNLGDASITGSIEFVVGGLAAGSGYTLALVGADSNGDPCSGASGMFTVVANTENYVGVNVICTIPTDAAIAATLTTGNAQVDAGITLQTQGPYQCPGISSFSIMPALAADNGAPVQLAITQVGSMPGTVQWSTSASTVQLQLVNQTSSTATAKCIVSGTYTITATLSLNVIPLETDASVNVCKGQPFTTLSGQLNCTKAGG